MTALAVATSVVLVALSLLHVYWAAGGRRGIDAVIPTMDGRRTLNPSAFVTLVVAMALGVAAVITLGATGMWGAEAPGWLIRTGLVVLAVVFGARAVGDFRLIGFTKRVTDTQFARLDTRVFSPLCIGLAVACVALAWLSNQAAP